MDPDALADCALALGRDPADVLELRESADLLPALLARLVLALDAKPQYAPGKGEITQRLLAAVLRGWGERPFTAGDLIAWARQGGTPHRNEVSDAVRALCGLSLDAELTAQRFGIALAQVASTPTYGPLRIVVVSAQRGAKTWAVRDLRD